MLYCQAPYVPSIIRFQGPLMLQATNSCPSGEVADNYKQYDAHIQGVKGHVLYWVFRLVD